MKTLRLVALSFCLVATLLVSPLILKPANAAPTKVNCSEGGYISIENKAIVPSEDEEDDQCYGSVSIPSGVLTIPDFAFESTEVTTVNIPTSVSSIGNAAFADADILQNINVAEPNSSYTSAGGVLFNNDKTSLIAFPSGKRVETYTVPAGVTSIRNYAFSGNKSYGIILPTSVSDIEAGAFRTGGLLEAITVTEPNASYTSVSGALFNNDETTIVAYPVSKSGASYFVPSGVTAIEDFAFSVQRTIQYLSIPSTVTSIGISAFEYSYLGSVNFDSESELEIISEGAFEGSSLDLIEIPNGVKTIGSRAFAGTSLATIEIPSGLQSIGARAFYGMGNLERITVVEPNSNYSSVEGVLFDDSMSTLITYPYERSRAYYTIPSGVASIAEGAFYAGSIWSTKTRLQVLTIPSSVTSIGKEAFARNESLDEITFEPNSGLETIGNEAFSGTSIPTISIPASVSAIGGYAFSDSNNLKSVRFAAGSQLKSIGQNAFSYTEITTITIPKSVTSIGREVFQSNDNLKSVKFEAGSQLKSIGENAFSYSLIPAITIPASVTSIGKEAFQQMNRYDDFSVYFLGNAPATTGNLSDIGAPAYIRSGAKGFSKFGSTWKGLTVEKTPTTAILNQSIS